MFGKIRFFTENGRSKLRISLNGKSVLYNSSSTLSEYKKICEQFGYKVYDGVVIKRDVSKIVQEYKRRTSQNRVKVRNLQIHNVPTEKAKIKRGLSPLGKKAIGIASMIGMSVATVSALLAKTKIPSEIIIDVPPAFAQARSPEDNSDDGLYDYSQFLPKNEETQDNDNIEIVTAPFVGEEPYNTLDPPSEETPIIQQEQPNEENASAIEAEETIIEQTSSNTEPEINSMFNSDSFNISHEDRSYWDNIINVRQYEDLFKKYAKMYGLDHRVLMGIAAHESGGKHEEMLDCGYAKGMMQININVFNNIPIRAYNFEKQSYEEFIVTADNVRDLETNIKIGAIIFQMCLRTFRYENIAAAIQSYNQGTGSITNMLAEYQQQELGGGQIHPNDSKWLEYCNKIEGGDPLYLSRVLAYIDSPDNNQSQYTFQTPSGETVVFNVSYNIENTKGK